MSTTLVTAVTAWSALVILAICVQIAPSFGAPSIADAVAMTSDFAVILNE